MLQSETDERSPLIGSSDSELTECVCVCVCAITTCCIHGGVVKDLFQEEDSTAFMKGIITYAHVTVMYDRDNQQIGLLRNKCTRLSKAS